MSKTSPSSTKQWLERCAARLREIGLSDRGMAFDVASSLLENLNGDLAENPEEAADDEMSYWTAD